MPACSVTSVNCIGPDGRSGERDLAGGLASLASVPGIVGAGPAAASESCVAIMLWVTGSGRATTVERDTPVLQPEIATIDTRNKYSLKARDRFRNSSRGNGRTGGTCASRI